MGAPIDFYFDFSSPYGYFASRQIEALGAKHGRAVAWRPILLGAIFKVTGGQPLPNLPLKGDYAKHDMLRCARLMQIPYRFPSRFPIATQAPARALCWAQAGDATQGGALAKALYQAYFADDRDISQADVTADVAADMGFERARVLTALEDAAVKDRLRQSVDAAIANGVFGSPFVIVDGEPFWGHDRFEQIDRWLATGGW